MKQKHYTVGLILKQGLLLNRNGVPCKDKAGIIRILRKLKHTKIQTPWGPGYSVPANELEKYNASIKAKRLVLVDNI